MKVIIAGSRSISRYEHVQYAILKSKFSITEVVSGGAKGVDDLGERWAKENHVPVKHFYADWTTYGLSAGPTRNAEMAKYADALIAIWDGKSHGTQNMIDCAKRKKLWVYVYKVVEGS